MKLTRSELEVMETLWLAERPLPRSEIIELSPKRSWSASTIHILLNGLLEKGAIREAGFVKRNKTYGRLYAPIISGEDYFANNVFSDERIIPMYFSALLKCDALSADVVQELENMLTERKKVLQEAQQQEQEQEEEKENENEND